MSANNVVWVMNHITFKGLWHVFYSGCMDNTPDKPDFKDKYYKVFDDKNEALVYAHEVVDRINEFSLQKGHVAGVEYGVCIIPKKAGPWKTSGLATIMEYVDGIFRIRRYGWEAILPRNHIDCMKRSIGGIYAFSLKEGREVEWVKMKSIVDHLEIEDTIAHILPTLDALYIASKTVTNKDIQDFVKLVESMVGDLQQELITKENRIKERLCILEDDKCKEATGFNLEEIALLKEIYLKEKASGGEKEVIDAYEARLNKSYDTVPDSKPREPLVMPQQLKDIMKGDVKRYIKNTYVDGHNDGIKRGRILESKENGIRKNRKDGCYQFTYCNECLAYPMGLGCPNLTKGPVQLKDEVKKNVFTDSRGGKYYGVIPPINCGSCKLYGECDHQGAYKTKDGKWCYE